MDWGISHHELDLPGIRHVLCAAASQGNVDVCQSVRTLIGTCNYPDLDCHCLQIVNPSDIRKANERNQREQSSLDIVRWQDYKVIRLATEHGHLAVCQFFLDAGLDPPSSIAQQSIILKMAAKRGDVAMCQLFTQWRAKDHDTPCWTMDCVRYGNCAVLREAATCGNLKVCKFLKAWSDEQWRMRQKDDWLTSVDLSPSSSMLQSIFGGMHPRGLTPSDVHRSNALVHAAENGHAAVCKFINKWQGPLSREFALCQQQEALHRAAQSSTRSGVADTQGHLEVCRLLKSWGMLTVKDVRDVFLDIYPQVTVQNPQPHVNISVCQFFKEWRDLASHSRLTLNDVQDPRLFRKAARHGDIPMWQFLKQWGVTLQDVIKSRAIYDAAENTRMGTGNCVQAVVMFQFFLNWRDEVPQKSGAGRPARLTFRDVYDSGALVAAAAWGNVPLFKFFRDDWPHENGPGLMLEQVCTSRALHWAISSGKVALCQFFQEWGLTAELASFWNVGEVLTGAAENGDVDMCRWLKGWGLTRQHLLTAIANLRSGLRPWNAFDAMRYDRACAFLDVWECE